jgi:hypothetical protein
VSGNVQKYIGSGNLYFRKVFGIKKTKIKLINILKKAVLILKARRFVV